MPVSEKISDRETMMAGDLARYLAVGADALRAIQSAPGLVRPR
ncbi:hypothetical protein [Arenimonas sp.]|nr:hypothetical protein [Arenimonas sp.]